MPAINIPRDGIPDLPLLTQSPEGTAYAKEILMNAARLGNLPPLENQTGAMAKARELLFNASHIPTIPSLTNQTDAMAKARAMLYEAAHLSANTSAKNETAYIAYAKELLAKVTNIPLPLHQTADLNNINATATMAAPMMAKRGVDATGLVKVDPENHGLAITSYIILGVFFSFFLYIVVVDMVRKNRTGELRDDMEGTKKLFVTIVKGIPRAFANGVRKIKNASIFRKKETKAESAEDAEAREKNAAETKAIIARLAGKDGGCAETVEQLDKVISKSVFEPLGDGTQEKASDGSLGINSELVTCGSSSSSVV